MSGGAVSPSRWPWGDGVHYYYYSLGRRRRFCATCGRYCSNPLLYKNLDFLCPCCGVAFDEQLKSMARVVMDVSSQRNEHQKEAGL